MPGPDGPPPQERRTTLSLAALFLAAFVAGTAELVVVGVLTLVAGDLEVDVAVAGVLVTSYALGIAVGGPALTFLTIRMPRRTLLRVAFALYLVGNLLAAMAATFGLLVLARAVTGVLHGLFVGVALGVAAALVPRERMGQAIGVVLGGIAMSTAFGVPLGTLIGQSFGWQETFLSVVGLGVVALVGLVVLVPHVELTGTGGGGDQARWALAPRVLLVLLTGFLVMGGQFAALTFLTPFLEEVTGATAGAVTIYLMVYGVASAAGTLLGGRAADRNANLTLVLATIVVVLSLGAMYLGGASPVIVSICLVTWGLAGWGLVPSLQYRTVVLAGPGRDLAATLPASATTGGIAVGAVLGGWGIASFGPSAPVLVAAVACLVVLPLVLLSTRLTPPAEPGPADAAPADPAPADPVLERGQQTA